MRVEKIIKYWLVGTVIAIFAGIVLHGPISVGLSTLWPDMELVIKAWKECLMMLALVPLVVAMTKRHMWPEVRKDTLSMVLVSYIVLNLLMLLVSWHGIFASIAGLLVNLRFVGFFLLVYWTLKMYPESITACKRVFFAGAAVVVTFAVLQVTVLPHDVLKYIGYGIDTIPAYHTVDSDEDFVRIGSTLRGPNPLGAYMVIVISAVGAFLLSRRGDRRQSVLAGVLLAASVVTVLASYSRSAWVGVLVSMVVLLVVIFGRKIAKWAWTAMAGLLLVGAVGLFALRDNPVISSVIFHESPDSGSLVKSDDERVQSWLGGLHKVSANPLGSGVGSTGTPSYFTDTPLVIENQFLYVAHETGWLGLALFVVSVYLVLSGLWQRRSDWLTFACFSSGIGLVVIGLIQPVWVDDTVSIIWWGMAAVCLAAGSKR